MTSNKEFFKEFFDFFNNPNVVTTSYVNDLGVKNSTESFSSYNNINTADLLEAVVVCLVQKGIKSFESKAKEIIKQNGLKALKNEFEKISRNIQDSTKDIAYEEKIDEEKLSNLKYLMNEEDWAEWNESKKYWIKKSRLNKVIKKAIEKGLQTIRISYYDFLKRYSHLYIKSTFLIDKEFMRKFGEEIFDYLLRNDIVDGRFSDFKSFAKGEHFEGHLIFNQPSTLGTFIRVLKEKKLLITGGNYWQYVTINACKIKLGKKTEYSASYMSKTFYKHRNKKVENMLDEIMARFKKME